MGCTSSSSVKKVEEVPSPPPPQSEKAIKAAVLIQKWYRRYVARLEIRRRCMWNIFQSIEYAGEQDSVKLYNFFTEMLSQMSPDQNGLPKIMQKFCLPQRPAVYDSQMLQAEEEELHGIADPEKILVEPSYKGPHLTFPLTQRHLHILIQSFKSRQLLHAKYVIELLFHTRRLLKSQANISYASTSIAHQITVCGDLHGKLDDLYMVFYKNGLPSVDNPYIFNGDFVDRGPCSVEVVVILFVCFLLHPNEVYLNRGNHEDHVMNLRYGFVKELGRKYRHHAKKMIKVFEDVFSWLPLATVVDNKVLVVHGGVSDVLDLEFLARIDRHKFLSTLQPPAGHDEMDQNDKVVREWKQILDLLWSDPKSALGCFPNTFRGGGVYFGPDVTELILRKNKFQLLIRSHECKPEGYEYTHNDRVLTVFSASNYYELGSNKGAYVKLHGPDLQCHIVQYMSNPVTTGRRITFTQRISHVESAALDDLRDRIIAVKYELMTEFQKYDQMNTGKMRLSDWCFAVETVLEMDLPWRTLRSKLAKIDKDGMVIYATTFEELRVQHRYSGNGPTITEMLYRHKDNLETIFRIMDKDNSGCISMEEFEEALGILMRHEEVHINPSEVKDLAKSIDINNDGFIDFNEFLEAFRIVDQFGKEKPRRKSGRMESPRVLENIRQLESQEETPETDKR